MYKSIRSVYRKFYNFYTQKSNQFKKYRIRRNMHRLIPLMKTMADTGLETDECLKNGFLPMPVHFYSPVLDIDDLEQRQIWDRISPMAGIKVDVEKQLSFLTHLGKTFGNECQWPQQMTSDDFQFYTHNGSFSYGCASALYTIIRNFKPHKVIEIGSGNSSLIVSSALQKNGFEDPNHISEYTIIDPYPNRIVQKGLPGNINLIKERVELQNIAIFEQLGENDILFVDSGHTVRQGGDVNYIYLDILPLLKPGVLIHIHDIGLPYDYPKVYATNPNFRVFWTEAYLLQAFLAFNSAFEILLMMNMIQTQFMDKFCAAFPHFDLETNWANSSSFWIRRKLE
jgi:hypothetical protein